MIYHRRESPTQDPDDAEQQERSMEIWGHPSRYSDIPKVKAFVGPLPRDARGVQFRTDVRPDPGVPPGRAYWTPPKPGVRLDGNVARLTVDELLNRQPRQ